MKRRTIVVAAILTTAAILFVGVRGAATLRTLTVVERERDGWQRPGQILDELDLRPGNVVVDLGSGAGYFTLKIASRVAPNGRVLAVDLRRQSLAFLWIRSVQGRHSTVRVIHGDTSDPRLPAGPVDAVLIANTYHELSDPGSILDALFKSMRPGARLVVVDREPLEAERAASRPGHHHVAVGDVEREILAHGFRLMHRNDRLIDRAPDDHTWWMLTFTRP